jgi:two-component system, sensor histidine kinase and response regulator
MMTCLYFDDEESLLNLFREVFADAYDVRTALTLAEARQILSTCAPDVIISDWSMPEISGVEFLREVREVCPASFRILLTGYGQVVEFFPEIGGGLVQTFLRKPWSEAEVREALERAALARPGGSRPS